MTAIDVEYRLRIRNAANSADALEITSVRGGTNPYIASVPTGDGASFDPYTGIVTSGSFSLRIVDPITTGTSRLFTSQLEDAGFRQQLGHRRAFLEYREDGGSWQVLYAGRLARYELANDITWDLALGDFMEAEHEYTVFDRKADTSEADGYEPFADYLTRWPNRGTILGGPILGDFRGVKDLGGWKFKVVAEGARWTRIEFMEGYYPNGRPIRNITPDVTDAINSAAQPFFRVMPGEFVISDVFGSQDMEFGTFPDIAVLVNGTARMPTNGRYEDQLIYHDAPDPSHLLHSGDRNGGPANSRGSIFLAGDLAELGLTLNQTVRVAVVTGKVSEVSPIYWTGHPVDLMAALWTEAGLPYDTASLETVRGTLGAHMRRTIMVTKSANVGKFLEEAVYGPLGVGVRQGDDGELEAFCSRIFANTVPAVEITSADVQEGSTRAFSLDTRDAVRHVVLEHERYVYGGHTEWAPFAIRKERFERDSADPGAIGTGEIAYDVPGEIHMLDAPQGMELRHWVDGRALEITDRRGRGPIRLKTLILRSSAALSAKVGDEILVNLPQLPNKNKRLIDDATVPARAMQIVHLTKTLAGNAIECEDSGPNANAISTLPTLSIAASTKAPRNIAEVTVTNAATLNASNYGLRLQMAITTGAAPAVTDYTDIAAYRQGVVPTTAIALPAIFADRDVYVRARTEKSGERPSNWTTPVSVALDAFDPPTGLGATPNASDGSECTLAWTLGADSALAQLEVYVRLQSEGASANLLVARLPRGSNRYTLEELTPGTQYTASVAHYNESTGERSTLATVNFTTSATAHTLSDPPYADGFSFPRSVRERPLGRPLGGSRGRGGSSGAIDVVHRYGLAVMAVEFPSDVEIAEAVETAVGSGLYGSYVTVGRVPSVSGEWTLWYNTAAHDGLRRKLKARHVREGHTTSGYTTEVVVDPSVHDPIAPFVAARGSLTMKQDGTSVLALDGSAYVNSYRYATSTSAYPSDATAAAGTPINGRAPSDVAVAFLDFGERVYITVIPYTGANGTGTAGPSIRLTITRVGGTDIPQGTVAISSAGAVDFSFEGPSWAGSYRYSTSTSSFPADATVASSGTILNGRVQASIAPGVTLTLGQTVYITIVPFRDTGAAGYQGSAIHLKATRHDFSATKTVSFGPAALTPSDAFSSTRYDFSAATGYLRSVNHGANSASTILHLDLMVPDGCTITGLSINAWADNGRFFPPDLTFASVNLSLVRCNTDGTTTAIGSASVSNVTGWNAGVNSSLSELTTGRQYRLYVTFNPTGTSANAPADGACRLATYSYTYSMPSSDKAI